MTTTTIVIAFTSTAHVSTSHLASILPSSQVSSFELKQRRRNFISRVRCASFTQGMLQSRRLVSLSFVFLHFFPLSKDAVGVSIFDKYVKKKKLDPLESYIPAVLLTGLQIKELEHSLEVDQPKFADCRSLLRSGPASSFRVNIRAVAQYASDSGNGKSAFSEADQCLRALEELDSLLLQASRNQSEASIEPMKGKIATALNALDRDGQSWVLQTFEKFLLHSLLQFVPSEVLDKGKAMADAYFLPEEELVPENLDPQLKQLESIL